MTGAPRELRAGRRPPLGGVPDWVWTPVVAGALTLLCGALGLAAGQPWLFPSIGPTAFLLAHSPHEESSRAWNVVVGHLVGLGAGYLAVALCRASAEPALFAAHALAPARVWASALAVALALAGQIALRASHPPAAATTLLVTLGGFRPAWRDALAVVAGVVIVALAGALLRPVHDRAARGRAAAGGAD